MVEDGTKVQPQYLYSRRLKTNYSAVSTAYQQLRKIRQHHPELTPNELKVYWLLHTNVLTLKEIMDLSELSLDEFNEVWQSIKHKIGSKRN